MHGERKSIMSYSRPRRRTMTATVILSLSCLAVLTTTTTTTTATASIPIPIPFDDPNNNNSNNNGPIPIDDATCNVEQLEEANDSQLFTILRDLRETSFFRNFAVDLSGTCPLASNLKKDTKDQKDPNDKKKGGEGGRERGKDSLKKEDTQTKTPTFTTTSDGDDHEMKMGGMSGMGFSSSFSAPSPFDFGESEGGCASEGLPDADPDEAFSSCHVDLGDDDDSHAENTGSGSGSDGGVYQDASDKEGEEAPTATATATVDEEKSKDEEEEEYECTGGDMQDEMDDDAEPLCHLTESELSQQQEYFHSDSTSMSKTPLQDLLSSALNAVNEKMGWESDSEKQTYLWRKSTNPVIVSKKTSTGEILLDDECGDEEGRLPDSFWIDMCSNIYEGDGMKMVDLMLNPERNTGYNGTHIWNAIYEENCIDIMDGLSSSSDDSNDLGMCYEERVMYRLLSGLHASTTLSIAKNYYPPNKKKGRLTWESNPSYFFKKFGTHPDHVRNLHFSYVVLLRALKKASPILNNYEIRTGNIVDDETATVLLKRLLDSSILKSCSDVFTAFDESLMFRPKANGDDGSGTIEIGEEAESKFPSGTAMHHPEQVITLQKNFKGVFHNISSILDCVQCQQCKLHGKMAMLGYGTALKILFMTNDEVIASSLTRNEIVALINTVAKFSESLREVRELTHLYWSSGNGNGGKDSDSPVVASPTVTMPSSSPPQPPLLPQQQQTQSNLDSFALAISAIDELTKAGHITIERERELVKLAIADDHKLLTIAKHYGNQLEKFYLFSHEIMSARGSSLGAGAVASSFPPSALQKPDAIVVGTGLAGLAATLNILDRGGTVLVLEKEHRVGGNSNKASSGINACRPDSDGNGSNTISNNSNSTDYIDSFIYDTTKSAGSAAQPILIETLTKNSWNAVTWLKERVGVDLSLVAQLGGHQHKRTHRPSNGMVGAEVIYGVQKAVREYEKKGKVRILTDTKVLELLKSDSGIGSGSTVTGVRVEYLSDKHAKSNEPTELYAPNVILATGGFAADRTDGSLLSKYRPELIKMPATAGPYSTGDGVALATNVGAGLIDMDKVQVHPTGWVDPKDPLNPNKVLAGELMRGVGGILINGEGKRFCNELGTRAYVTDMMLKHDPYYAAEGVWNKDSDLQTFFLVLSSEAASNGKKHIDHYIHKGLVTRLEGVEALAQWMEQDDVDALKQTFIQYRVDADNGKDKWGKTSFQGSFDIDLHNEVFYAGIVTPVLHYCMGGITIDKEGNVLDENGLPIAGLHAAGEVTGGVHGNNRLGGNSLLECTVYGTIVGKKIPIQPPPRVSLDGISSPLSESSSSNGESPKEDKLMEISMNELAKHNTETDCWVAIHGKIYDLTDFAESHPPGAESIYRLGGTDGTDAFQSIHNEGMLEDFEDDLVGVLV